MDIAEIYLFTKMFDKSIEFYQKAKSNYEKIHGEAHYHVAFILFNLSKVYTKRK